MNPEPEHKKFESKKQALLLGAIGLVAVLAVVFVVLANPRAVAPFMSFFTGIMGVVIFVVIWLVMLLGAGGLGLLSRVCVEKADKKFGYNIDISGWIHWAIALVFGIITGIAWTGIVPFLVNLPTLVYKMYVSLGWIGILNDSVPLGWGIAGMVMFVVGYWGFALYEWAKTL